MAALSDFNNPTPGKVALKDFMGSATRPPILNEATISNTAAYSSVLSNPNDIERNYLNISDELRYGASSPTMAKVVNQWDENDYAANMGSLKSMLSDPAVSVDQKASAVQNMGAAVGGNSLYTRVAQSALMAESEPDDNDEVEFTRIDTTSTINQVDEYNGWVQQQVNHINDLQNPNAVDSIKNVVELFLPFVEGANVAQVANDFYKEDGSINAQAVGQAMVFLGESKDSIRKAIVAMPLEQRKEAAEQLIQYIQNSNGPQALNPNDILALDQINSFLVTGSYDEEQKFIDNFSSVLDATLLGGTVFNVAKKALGGVADFARGSKLVGETAAVTRRYEAAINAVGESDIAASVNNILTPTDDIINSMYATDKMTADEITQARKVIDENLGGVDDVSIDNIIDNMSGLDKATSEEIAQARQALAGAVGKRNTELQSMVNEDTIRATRDLIGDRVIQAINRTGASKVITVGDNGIPADLFVDIRAIIDKKVTPATINSRTLGTEIVQDVQNVLSNRGLEEVNKSTGANLKGFITNNARESTIRRRYIKSQVAPTSIANTLQNTNPAKGRGVHDLVVRDTSGRAASIFYGTNRTDAIANDLLPEIAEEAGTVRNKISFDEAAPIPNKELKDEIHDARGDIHFSPGEKESMRNVAKDDWRDVQGLVPRVPMSQIGDTPRGVKFSTVYGPKDGGFSNARQAIDQAMVGLRKYGITESEIEVLVKDATGDYVPTKEFSKKGNYLIRVNHDYEFSPADTVAWATTESSKTWRLFDTTMMGGDGKAGGLAQHLIPNTVVTDPLLFQAASVASDRSAWINKRMLDLAQDYAHRYNGLDKRQKALVTNYIIEANANSLKFNSVNLKARGFDTNSVETVRAWKTVNDTLYQFENTDLNKTLRSRGYERFVDQTGKTDLIVKPVRAPGGPVKAFSNGKLVVITKQDIDELYEAGGTIAQTRSPIEFEDDAFEYVVVRQNSEGGFTRRIRDEDTTLTYRDGYYTVRYNDPYFITKEFRGKDGEVYTKAIASAPDRVSAERETARLRTTDEKGVYTFRGDIKKDPEAFADMEWSNIVSSGRTAQRIRGTRLNSVGRTNPDLNHLHIETPEESLVKSIRTLSNRVAFRDYIETAKTRFTNQFGDLIKDQKGQKKWPEDVRKIGEGNAEASLSRVKDARNTWRYIEAIDSGYVNLLDDASKIMFKNFSDVMGRQGWSHIEKLGRKAEQFNPSQFARKKAFRLMLAFNPIRQIVVQASQAIPVIAATNPLGAPRIAAQTLLINYMNRGGDINSFMKSGAQALTGMSVEEARMLIKNYERSGIESAVQANTLIRDDFARLVDRGKAAMVDRALSKPGNFLQKIGFEAGENILMRSIWLSEYDNLRKTKKAIGAEELDRLNARVRDLTLNMNRAGELPYNENALSTVMQFFQAPHKGFAQIIMGHRGLSTKDRLVLGASYITTFGLGANWTTDMISKIIPEDNPIKDVLEGGVFNILMNKTLSTLSGKDVEVNFSDSLRLLQVPNLVDFFGSLMDMQFMEVISNSPSAGLVIGDSPRITNFVKSMMRPFVVNNDRKPQEMAQVGLEFMKMFSGASNFFKAKYILEHDKVMGSTGQTIDYESNDIEALMRLAGFATIDEVKYYATNEKTYKASTQWRDDVTRVVTETSKRLATQGIDNDQQAYWVEMMAEAQRVHGNDPFYLQEYQRQVVNKINAGEGDLFKTLLNLSGHISEEKMDEILRNAPSNLTPEQIDAIRGTIQIIKESK